MLSTSLDLEIVIRTILISLIHFKTSLLLHFIALRKILNGATGDVQNFAKSEPKMRNGIITSMNGPSR